MFKNIFFHILIPLLAVSNSYADVPSSRRSEDVIQKISPQISQKLNEQNLKLGSPVYIRIFKESEELELWVKNEKDYKLFKKYPVCYYSGELGPKLAAGDGQSPEGFYTVKPAQLNPNSNFHLSFNIGYPNSYDKSHGRTGSAIMVHGNCVSIGCYAMTDPYIEEIYTIIDAAFRNGQKDFKIHIFPFKISAEALVSKKNHEWYDFWVNLKEGFDLFEENKIPPEVSVKNKRYVFTKGQITE